MCSVLLWRPRGTESTAIRPCDAAVLPAIPDDLALGLAAIEPRARQFLVILDLQVRKLRPDAGQVESVRVRREAAVRVVYVVADLFCVFDRLFREMRGLVQVGLGFALVPVVTAEQL